MSNTVLVTGATGTVGSEVLLTPLIDNMVEITAQLVAEAEKATAIDFKRNQALLRSIGRRPYPLTYFNVTIPDFQFL